MDMVNDGVEDLRGKYGTMIYRNYVSLNLGGRVAQEVGSGRPCPWGGGYIWNSLQGSRSPVPRAL